MPDTGAQDSQQASVKETEQGSEEKEETQTPEVRQPMTLDDYQQIQTELYAIGNTANKSIVTITGVVSDTDWFNNSYEREGQGCGTIIGESGGKLWILTEKKTIKDAAKIKVTFVNDAVAEAKLVGYDGNTGLAALTVDLEDLEDSTQNAITVMKTAGSNTIHKGSIVIALGSPLGTNYSILTGTITATNNEISTPDNNYSVYTTDIVASENGSGVLINTDGELVGVVMQSYSAASANTLTAVEISELMPVIDLLFADKEVPYFQKRDDERMPFRLCEYSMASINQDDGGICRGSSGSHVPGVLFMSGAVGNDEFAAWGGEVPVGYINGYSLFPFRSKAVQQQGVINFTCSSSSIFFTGFAQLCQLVVKNQFAVIKEASDECRFPVVHGTAGKYA